jgi:hypothetical protein
MLNFPIEVNPDPQSCFFVYRKWLAPRTLKYLEADSISPLVIVNLLCLTGAAGSAYSEVSGS